MLGATEEQPVDTHIRKHWTQQDIGDQRGRVAIVTGSNTGIGNATARHLVDHGATVVLACRDAAKANATQAELLAEEPPGTTEVEVLDLASLKSIRAFTTRVMARHARLDLLINNAGVMMPPLSRTEDGFELQIGVNHLGHFALSGLLLERLLTTPGSRVVTVSSMAHRRGAMNLDDLQWESRRYDKMASYGQSKLANLLFTFELQHRLDAAGSTTKATAAHPGWTATDLARHISPLFRILNPIVAMQPWKGALPTVRAAVDPEAAGGAYFGPHGMGRMIGWPAVEVPRPHAVDPETASRLWELSESLTGVYYDLQ
jgi:NAD(P)-dependent dehydrogenase (short-subunit alcohol dehydrogenase family)